ncbi:MAG: CPBP family glutamic-type intramembrane protease, partial [Nanoarchaeota archaeon]
MEINKTTFIKILLPALIGTSLVITLVEELRNIGILFFAIGSIAWFLLLIKKIEFLTNDDENDRLLKWFIYPAYIINLFFLIFNNSYRQAGAGWVYFILGTLTLLLYMTPQFKHSLIGIDKRLTKGIFWGSGIAFGFLFISKILPGFSLLVPELPFSVLGGIRLIVVAGFAPIMEESFFRGSILNILQTSYNLSFPVANFIQGFILFTSYHGLAYGLLLSAYSTLIELFGATTA